MKIVAIKDMSAGNESVGEMWQETKIFDPETPIIEIVNWAGDHPCGVLKKKLSITIADNKDDL